MKKYHHRLEVNPKLRTRKKGVTAFPFGMKVRNWIKRKRRERYGRVVRTFVPSWLSNYWKRDTPKKFGKATRRWRQVIEEMVCFSRGHIPDSSLKGFFNLFLDKDRKAYLQEGTVSEVQNKLQEKSWLIEEDDVRQELLFYLYSKIKFASRQMHPVMVARILGTNLRDYLFPILIKREGSSNIEEFSWDAIDNRLDREKALVHLPFNLRYLYYLHFILGMEREDIFPLFMYTSRAYNNMIIRLLKELKGVVNAPYTSEPE